MTNKINGIDVSECCFYNNGKCDNPNGMACNCVNNAVCYFKELKRIEQINSELISKANAYDKLVILANDRLDIIDRLKQENEKLRQDWRLDCLKCEYKNTKTDVDKYKQALEEIREITEQERDCINSELACCRLCEKLDLIKEKTNEVLNDRD